MPDAAAHLGITYKSFTNTLYRGKLILGRYEVVRTGIIPSKTYLKELEYLSKPEKETYESKFNVLWEDAVKPWRIAYKQKAERDKVKQFTGK